MRKYVYLLICALTVSNAYAFQKITIDKNLTSKLIAHDVYYLEDASGSLGFSEAMRSENFTQLKKEMVNFQVSKSAFWLRFTIFNRDNSEKKYLEVIQPLLTEANFYYPDSSGKYLVMPAGQQYPFHFRKYGQSTNFLYDLNINPGEEKTYYLKIRGQEQILVPIQIIASTTLNRTITARTLWFGVYCGIILVMVLYNFFVYLSIREKSYLYYVWHTLFVGLTQASLLGYTYKYLCPDLPWLANYSNFFFTCMVSIVGIQFLIRFMHLKKNARPVYNILRVFQCIYVVYLITSLAGYYSFTYGAILKTQPLVAIFILAISIYLYKKGFAEAKYYFIAWSSLMLGIIIYVAMDFGWLPYNNITAYSLVLGSAAEITLLSFALADKINIYKLEKERSQEASLNALRENERIIREQNVMLENKVHERTHELRIVNNDLNKVLKDLKDAEGQLVESEKMAALGQLTAGIAHEINNPINFVTSNVTPLKRDIRILVEMISGVEEIGMTDKSISQKQQLIEDYKEACDFDYLKTEIDHLLKGINEGAVRTAEIVKGLRIFSRVDEEDLKKADINEGLESTMVLVNNLLNNKIKLVKDYGNIPQIECYPGKLNQVFLNIITNAIYAINKQHGNEHAGVLKIHTSHSEKVISVKVTDNGTGMDDQTKKKIFEPFFTTKGVGEGTGLGMSIAYNIIKKHNGQIQVNSTPGAGTEFILDLPIHQDLTAN